MSGLFRPDRLVHFASQLASGNLVFFIGAGFSRDSENNTTDRLVRRLAARVIGICRTLSAGPRGMDADQLLATFKSVHSLSDIEEDSADFVGELARNYYPVNDWCVSALTDLAEILCDIGTPSLMSDIEAAEARLLQEIGSRRGQRGKWPLAADPVPLRAIDLDGLRKLPNDHRKLVTGKILFLEAMGFSCQEIMSGKLSLTGRKAVAQSFRNRLRRRHHVLARLAREGLSPILLTTNFDLLIEGAYRLAGFQEWGAPDAATRDDEPPTRHPYFARIAMASHFFEKRDGGRVASIVKIHGCADAFRSARGSGNTTELPAMLRSIVFTYREVQNWRQDSWSRDLVYTLLRTRAVAFCGYSTADPVLHDTVRNTYEEMAQRARPTSLGAQGEEAPAFFFAPAGSKEFHGLEVLRAASRAVGVENPKLIDHPNYLCFNVSRNVELADLDESFAWIFHAVFRRRQIQAVQAELGSVVSLLLGHPAPSRLLRKVEDDLARLWEVEQAAAEQWSNHPSARKAFADTVAWTEHFHPALLRDMAITQRIAWQGRPLIAIDDLRDGHWYYPANENFGWTAWGAVMELAIRHRVAEWSDMPDQWATLSLSSGNAPPRLAPLTNDTMPALAITSGAAGPLPVRLELSLGRFHRPGMRASAFALPASTVRWSSDAMTLPWTSAATQGPAARDLWNWAAGTAVPQTRRAKNHKDWIECLRKPQ